MAARALLLLVLSLGLGGCGSSDDGYQVVDESQIMVPDLSRGDGAKAVSAVEAAGLEARLADAGDDFDFDPSRDATGCEVTHQRPVAQARVRKGDRVTITVDCRQADWRERQGADWEAFADAYTAAFDRGCGKLFKRSSNGSLSEAGRDYSVTDCELLNPSDPADARGVQRDVPDEPDAAGAADGERDGCRALFGEETLRLSDGALAITADDCLAVPGGVRVREPSPEPDPLEPDPLEPDPLEPDPGSRPPEPDPQRSDLDSNQGATP